MSSRPLKIAIVSGEESGDLLGADLVRALQAATGREVQLVGLGGRHLEALGLVSLFDAGDIALMGITAVLRDLPRLIRRIGQTARAIVAEAPDCLITIDSPDFTLRVAKKVRAQAPGIPIVHYVCPSVWAWRPSRAAAMKPYVDEILCLLPFEADALRRLGGPSGTFVGHRLTTDAGVIQAAALQTARNLAPGGGRTLLLLPGSRRGEVSALLPAFEATIAILADRGVRPRLLLPTVPHVADRVRSSVAGWKTPPRVITDPDAKFQAFGEADAALIASGTVSLELALSGVPMVACYMPDLIVRTAHRLITTWSALLPNLIADRAVVPEFYDRYIRPGLVARHLEALMQETPARDWQRKGLAEVAHRMATDRPAGELAASAVLKHLK